MTDEQQAELKAAGVEVHEGTNSDGVPMEYIIIVDGSPDFEFGTFSDEEDAVVVALEYVREDS